MLHCDAASARVSVVACTRGHGLDFADVALVVTWPLSFQGEVEVDLVPRRIGRAGVEAVAGVGVDLDDGLAEEPAWIALSPLSTVVVTM